MNIANVVKRLRQERDRAAKEVVRLDTAIAALNGGPYGKRTGTRNLSAEARAKIAAAQRVRWAKVHASKGNPNDASRPKRTMSAAARAKIAKAQRLRWANLKRPVQKAA